MKTQMKREFLYDLSLKSDKLIENYSNDILYEYDDNKIEYLFEQVMIPIAFAPAFLIAVLGASAYKVWKESNKKLHFDIGVCRDKYPLFSKDREICILKSRISDLQRRNNMMKSALKKVVDTEKGKKIKEKIKKKIDKNNNKIQEYKNDLQKVR